MDQINHTERAHALLSASGASRWMSCTPSARLEDSLPKETSVYAEEGTLAHELAELILRKELSLISPKEFAKKFKELSKNPLFYEDMEEEVRVHVDYVLSQYIEANRKTNGGAIILLEQKIDLTEFIEEGYGTGDVSIISDGTLEIIDLKFGKGKRVYATDNPQLKLYGLGSLVFNELSYDITTVKLTITQPRLDSISSWEISAEDLKEWGNSEVKQKAALAYEGGGDLVAGDHCQFCKVKPRCRALFEANLEIAKHDFKDPRLLSDQELEEAYLMADPVTDWLKSVSTYMLSQALNGKKWERFKVVEARSNRVWTDAEAIKKVLIDKGYSENDILNAKLKGIGDIEKLVKKPNFDKLLGAFVTKPKGSPTLVNLSDSRPEYTTDSAKDDFSDNPAEDLL